MPASRAPPSSCPRRRRRRRPPAWTTTRWPRDCETCQPRGLVSRETCQPRAERIPIQRSRSHRCHNHTVRNIRCVTSIDLYVTRLSARSLVSITAPSGSAVGFRRSHRWRCSQLVMEFHVFGNRIIELVGIIAIGSCARRELSRCTSARCRPPLRPCGVGRREEHGPRVLPRLCTAVLRDRGRFGDGLATCEHVAVAVRHRQSPG